MCQHLLVYLVRLVSFNLHRPTRSTPLSPHLARRVDQARELWRGRSHRLRGGGGWRRPPVLLGTTCTARGARYGATSASPVNE